MAELRPTPLTTWSEIASYLGVSVRTAQTYERTQGLPVYRLGGEKSRVYTYPEDLDRWRKSSRASAQQDDSIDTRGEPEIAGLRTGNTSDWQIRLWWVAGILATLLGTTLVFYNRRSEMTDFKVEGRSLIVIGNDGRELWRHTFPSQLDNSAYSTSYRSARSWLGILAGEHHPVFLFAATLVNRLDAGETLYCFDRSGKIKWSFKPGRPVTDRGGSLMLPPYFITQIGVVTERERSKTRVAVSSNHYLEQAEEVALLDPDGKVAAEYWHPGHLDHMAIADLERDGKPELLLGGVNNGHHQATVVILDPLKLTGFVGTTPSPDARFDIVGMPPAQEKAVIFFPRSCVSRQQPYTRVSDLHVTKQRVVVTVAEGANETNSAHLVYDLDFDLRVRSISGTDSYREKHELLQLNGIVDHPLTPNEFQRLEDRVIVRRSSHRTKTAYQNGSTAALP